MYRVLIIDDEAAARSTLREYIQSSGLPFQVAGEASDGKAGLALAEKLKPDVLFLDICMPELDGLSLLKNLRAAGTECKAVMLTAYSDFNYARLSVELHAFDYMLKPLRQENLRRLLKKLASVLEEEEQAVTERQRLKLSAERNCSAYQNTVLSRFLKKDASADIITDAQKLLPTGQFFIAAYSLEKDAGGQRYFDRLQSLLEQSRGPFEQVFVIDITDELFASIHYITEKQKVPDLFDAYFELLSHQLHKLSGITPAIGLSSIHSRFEEAPAAYSQAVAAVSSQFSLPDQPLIHFEQCSRLVHTCGYPQELEAKLLSAVLYGNSGNALLYTNQFFDYLLAQDLNTALLKQMCMHFGLAVLKKVKANPQFDPPAQEEEPCFFDLARYRTVHDFKLFLSAKLFTFANQADQTKRSASNQKFVTEVRGYLKDNLSKDVGLSDIAGYFGLTPSYFSTLFKREFQENFVEYFTRNKLDYANQLLRDPKLSISEISKQLGYNDPRYFFKVYKKYEGISPGEYRKQAHMAFLKEPEKENL